jgi:hypothetical protein
LNPCNPALVGAWELVGGRWSVGLGRRRGLECLGDPPASVGGGNPVGEVTGELP